MNKLIKLIKAKPLTISNIKKVIKIVRTHGIKEVLVKLKNQTQPTLNYANLPEQLTYQQSYYDIVLDYIGEDLWRPAVVFTTPCLSYGGGEIYLLNLAQAIHQSNPNLKIYIVVPEFIGECQRDVHGDYSFITVVPCRDFLIRDDTLAAYAFLKLFITMLKPIIVHNINSVTCWQLFINEPEIKHSINKLYASIFCQQYDKYGNLNGFAQEFLTKGMPQLDLLTTDNGNFKQFVAATFKTAPADLAKIVTFYTPCKYVLTDEIKAVREKYASKEVSDFATIKLVWIARLDDQKNVQLLYSLAREYPQLSINVYGSKLIDTANDYGQVPANICLKGLELNIAKIMLDDDYTALIMTSKYEGIPNILVIGGFFNVPIIAPDVGGISDLINRDTGYLLTANPTPGEYMAAIEQIRSQPDERIIKSQNLLNLINRRHTLEHLCTTLAEVNYLPFSQSLEHNLPLVSVIIPCYNQYQFLLACIESVYRAYCGPLEIIVLDDDSTDLKKTQFQFIIAQIFPHVQFINNAQNLGLAATRNKGLRLASGEYIQFLDADDLLLPNKISQQVSTAPMPAEKVKTIKVCDYLLSDHTMSNLKYEASIKQFKLDLATFLLDWERGFCIPIHTALFPNSIKEFNFNEDLAAKEDWVFWLTLISNDYHLDFSANLAVVYRMNQDSMTNSRFIMSGQAWINAAYFILKHIGGIDCALKCKFLSMVAQHYHSWYVPMSIKELEAINQQQILAVVASGIDEVEARVNEQQEIDFVLPLSEASHNSVAISIIIPVYNHYEYLWSCIGSALNQHEVSALEIIVLNDNSSDKRVSGLLNTIKESFPQLIKLVEFHENQGISKVQNYAINLARGKYIAFLDCDDYLEPNALAEVNRCLSNQEIDYLFTDHYQLKGTVKERSYYGGYKNIHFTQDANIYHDLLDGMVANHLKVIKRSALIACGLFDLTVAGVQDWDLALKFCQSGYKFKYLALALYNHRLHSNSVTNAMHAVQFKLTNIVRRRNVELRFPYLTAANRSREKALFTSVVELAKLHAAIAAQKVMVFILNDASVLADYWFFNEFNAYFDYVYLSDASKYALISGYLWNQQMVKIRS